MSSVKTIGRIGGSLLAAATILGAGLVTSALPAAAIDRAACPAVGPVSSPWGPRGLAAPLQHATPFSDAMAAEFHDGVDIAAAYGSGIYAVQDGEVIFSATADPKGYGQYVQIRHDDGSTSEYGHMSQRLVAKGDMVLRGELIAKVGSEGSSTGAHLHLRIYPGAPGSRGVDPQPWLRARGIDLPCTPADNPPDEPMPEPPTLVGGSKDFTGDGRADVLARDADGALWLYEANAAGLMFTERVRVGSGWNIMSWMYAADVNRDGRPDVVARDKNGVLWLYKANFTGQLFTERVQVGSGWNIMSWMGAADADGDGLIDMVARHKNGTLWVYRGTGTSFEPKAVYSGSGWNAIDAILIGDLNGDDRADLVGRDETGKLWSYASNATGLRYTGRAQVGSGWNIMNGISLTTDSNADGRPDIVARDEDGKLWLYPNTGGGGTGMFGGPRVYAGSGWQSLTAIL